MSYIPILIIALLVLVVRWDQVILLIIQKIMVTLDREEAEDELREALFNIAPDFWTEENFRKYKPSSKGQVFESPLNTIHIFPAQKGWMILMFDSEMQLKNAGYHTTEREVRAVANYSRNMLKLGKMTI